MNPITTKDLKESLTLLLLQRQDDGEGGWRDKWTKGLHLWASLWPLIGAHQKDTPHYRIVIRAGIILPPTIAFLWHIHQLSKRLFVVSKPVLIQYNRFLSMTARDEKDA